MRHLKFLLLTLCGLGVLTSCSSYQTYYQICDVSSQLPVIGEGNYQYKDASCSLTYDFWTNGGNPGFVFTNNSDAIIYIDLDKSFFIKNGKAFNYFLNRKTSTTHSTGQSSSATKSGTIYGYWTNYISYYPGSLSASIGSGSSSSQSFTVCYEEQCVIAIPPHSSKTVYEYAVSPDIFTDCDYNTTPNKKQAPTYQFSLTDTPISFSNYITYRVGNDPSEHTISNDFFINSTSFYHYDAIHEKRLVSGCNGDEEKDVIKFASPRKFYIRYSKEKSKVKSSPSFSTERKDGKYDDLY